MKVTVTGRHRHARPRAWSRRCSDRGDEVTVLSRDADRARSDARRRRDARWSGPSPRPGPAPGRGAGGPGRRGPPARRARRPALERRRQARDPRLARARPRATSWRRCATLEPTRPAVLVSQSASGWYGPRGDERVDESEPAADDFLAQVCVDWEAEARAAEELGMRVALHPHRRGAVRVRRRAGEDAAARSSWASAARWPAATSTCRGSTPTTWSARWLFCLDTETATGPLNLTAPEPVTNKELSKALGRCSSRPAFAPVPALAVKAALRRDGHRS